MYVKINMVKYMKSRMDRYYKDESSLTESRAEKNKNAYNNSGSEGLDKVDVETSVEVIGKDISSMDIDSLRGLLEDHYSKEKNLEDSLTETINLEETTIEDTKEYDLKKVLEDAKKNRESDYDKDRFKKIRDTQYDILKNLNLDRKDSPVIDEKQEGEDKLMELIKTVEFNATKAHKKIEEEKDLMSDLLADDDEDVLEPVNLEEETFDGTKASLAEELEKTINVSREELEETDEKEMTLTEVIDPTKEYKTGEFDNTKTSNITTENTFYTGKYSIKSNDFDKDSFEDLEKDLKFGNVFIKILVTIIILVVLFIAVYFVDGYFHLGLFK